MKTNQKDIKKLFWKKGTCSHTLFHILNNEFGVLKETEEQASDPLAGGVMKQGHQCGMLWGAALAVGAESFRRYNDTGQAISHAINTSKGVMESFVNQAGSANCRDITNCNLTSTFGLLKLILFKRNTCTNLMEQWVPEAYVSASEGLTNGQSDRNLPTRAMSCASEVAKKMGATDEEMVMVAGFAGGIGLSGKGCGALSAAIWMKTLSKYKKQEEKSMMSDPDAKKILNAFYAATGREILCHKITKRSFETIEEHTEFIKKGGCDPLINSLAQS
jgi:C_GCAxxG_C_C family probable redox protein